jgi:tRNA pseudouridine55 synthase
MATGVLIVGFGRATRLLGHLALHDKVYRATIRLGQHSDTDDATGSLSATVDASSLSEARIRAAMSELTGELLQVPSAVSAVKVDGQRAYARVRAGEDVSLDPRSVHIALFELHAVRRREQLLDLEVRVECSTGTYVRALARDLGRALAVGGHVTALRRTRVGCFDESEAQSLETLMSLSSDEIPALRMSAVAERAFPTYRVEDGLTLAIRNGRCVPLNLAAFTEASPVALLTHAGEFLALYEPAGSQARAVAVFAPA